MSKIKFWLVTFLFMFGALNFLLVNLWFTYEVDYPTFINWTADSVLRVILLVVLVLVNGFTLFNLYKAYKEEYDTK